MTATNTPSWQQEHPDYAGWLAEYGGGNWGEVGEIVHPPTAEGRHAAQEEAQEFQDYHASKTDDEGCIEELYSTVAPLASESADDFPMCDCCDWGYGWMDPSAALMLHSEGDSDEQE